MWFCEIYESDPCSNEIRVQIPHGPESFSDLISTTTSVARVHDYFEFTQFLPALLYVDCGGFAGCSCLMVSDGLCSVVVVVADGRHNSSQSSTFLSRTELSSFSEIF